MYMNLLSYYNGSLFCILFDMTIQYNIPCLLSFCPLSPLSLASQPSTDLRQFAKQEALQHTAIPAHLDRTNKHTLMRPNMHPRTCTHIRTTTHALKFIRFTRMSQQDIRALEDHIWYGMWMVNEPIRAQHCICVHLIWTVAGSNAINAAAIFPWQNDWCQCSCEKEKILRGSQWWFGAAECVEIHLKLGTLM